MLLKTQVLAYLMGSLLTGCVGFPTLHPRLLDMKNGKCYEYPEVQQSDACHIQFGKAIEHPISYCEGNFALPPEDVAALRSYQKYQCANQPK